MRTAEPQDNVVRFRTEDSQNSGVGSLFPGLQRFSVGQNTAISVMPGTGKAGVKKSQAGQLCRFCRKHSAGMFFFVRL